MKSKRTVNKELGKTAKKKSLPVLTLEIDGPRVKKGRISVPDLIKLCTDAQNAVTRQAEALEGRKTLHPGPAADSIKHECTLELIAIRGKCTALDFGFATPQLALPFAQGNTFASEVVEELALTIESLGNGNKKKDIDPGVLQSIYSLSAIVESGRVAELNWIIPQSTNRKVEVPITKKVRERAAARLSGPRFKVVSIDGILDMADFSRRERKCRIDPAIGSSVICTFAPEQEDKIHGLLRQPVRATGLAKIQPHSDKIDSLEVQTIEPLPSIYLGEGNFFASANIEQLARSQGTKPVTDIAIFAGVLPDDEVDEFVSTIYDAREP